MPASSSTAVAVAATLGMVGELSGTVTEAAKLAPVMSNDIARAATHIFMANLPRQTARCDCSKPFGHNDDGNVRGHALSRLGFYPGQREHQLAERIAARLEIAELVERRAGGREQHHRLHHVRRLRVARGERDGLVERADRKSP